MHVVTLDNDGIKSQRRIVGNIYLQQNRNSDKISLVHDEGGGWYSVLVSDCRSVYYDSLESRIYIKEQINEWNNTYYSFILKDPQSRSVVKALEKHKVLEATFKKRIKKKSCVQIELKLDEVD